MNSLVERSHQLKQAAIDFVYDAEDDLAVALETYAAQYTANKRYDRQEQDLMLDAFLNEGRVGNQAPWEIFLATAELTESDHALVRRWSHCFTGLFEVIKPLPGGYELMNWLSAKHYVVLPNPQLPNAETLRWQAGETLLTRLTPVSETQWTLSGAVLPKGKLGKPKLAVAIGEFKDKYKSSLYSDAPELLEQAWQSVAQFHEEFVAFFGSDRITLPGYQLNQKLSQLQEQVTQTRLKAVGIDPTKSLKEMAQDAGLSEAEIAEATANAGEDRKGVEKLLESKLNASMVIPKINLPDEIKNAQEVTAFSHPRWGQIFIPAYTRFEAMLSADVPQAQPNCEPLVRKYLEDPQINYFIWQQLKADYPSQLEQVLQSVLSRPDFNLERDLEPTLQAFDKPLTPQLPETASIPKHLNDLFEEVLTQMSKSKPKGKKKKATKGFG